MPGTILDIFNSDAFSTMELTAGIKDIEYTPGLLGDLGLFEPEPIRTRSFAIEKTANGIGLIQTSAMGSPPPQVERDPRTLRDLRTVRLAEGFTIYAYELEGIREFGETTVLMQVQDEYAQRMQKLKNRLELTREHHRLGALQGKLLDADGTTVIYDYFTELGYTEAAAINFNLDIVGTDLRKKCNDLVRSVARSSKGAMGPGASVHSLAGDDFYDAFIEHPKVIRTYEHWAAAADLRKGTAFQAFTFGGITWHNYRGTDDNSTVAIDVDEAKFFPVGGNGVFKHVMSPAEFNPWVNTLGEPDYALSINDKDRNAWNKGELYSYPLFLCARPNVLRKGIKA